MSVNLERRSGTERRHQKLGTAMGKERRCSAEQRVPEFDEMLFSDFDLNDVSIKPAPKAKTTVAEEAIDFQDRIRN